MDLDRPHHRTTSSSELFICFTSRLSSSSSMKISKSILSPGRNRDQPMSLPTSLSRRLRTNGSIKGGQASPMFPSTNTSKKRGCAFENPEPSSPKVTCIGQVRVKTKKKAAAARKQTRSLSRRRSGGGGGGGGGEVSFRKLEDGLGLKSEDKCGSFGQGSQRYAHPQQQPQQQECLPHRNQRWVHLPLTICEALRAFGAEFSCLFPCKSWCFSTSEREKEEKGNGSRDGQQSSCGAVFARWLVTLQDGEGGKEREIELVVGEDEESTRPRTSTSTRRRHVLEDFEVNGEIFEAKGQSGGGDGGGAREEEEKEDEARVSICIPPKNALLLMRCRSDPVKMAALTNRFWEAPPIPQDEEHENEDDDEDLEKLKQVDVRECEDMEEAKHKVGLIDDEEKHEMDVQVKCIEMEDQVNDDGKAEMVEEKPESNEQAREEVEEVQEEVAQRAEEEIAVNSLENNEEHNNNQIEEKEEEESLTSYSTSCLDGEEAEATRAVLLAIETALQEEMKVAAIAETESSSQETTTTTTQLDCETEDSESSHYKEEVEDQETESRERTIEKQMDDKEEDSSVSLLSSSASVLPDCLLLMMCEPKLSMEVSKETWVCRTDFIRCLPQRHNNKQVKPLAAEEAAAMNDDVKNAADEAASMNKRVSIDSKLEQQPMIHPPPPALPPQLAVPPRSSCSLPAAAAVSMATMIEQKLVNAVGYEPFVLTRCKSEPMRTAAKLAAPDTCFWTKRKLEPLRRAAFQVGAAGVGF